MAISRHELLEKCIEQDVPFHKAEGMSYAAYLDMVMGALRAVNQTVRLTFKGA